jgi:hypothetical protein
MVSTDSLPGVAIALEILHPDQRRQPARERRLDLAPVLPERRLDPWQPQESIHLLFRPEGPKLGLRPLEDLAVRTQAREPVLR